MAFTLAPLPYAHDALEPHIDTTDHANTSWQTSPGLC